MLCLDYDCYEPSTNAPMVFVKAMVTGLNTLEVIQEAKDLVNGRFKAEANAPSPSKEL